MVYKKLLITLAVLSFPLTTLAYTGSWSFNSTTVPVLFPTSVKGIYPPITVPYITASSTTGTSTFAGLVNILSNGTDDSQRLRFTNFSNEYGDIFLDNFTGKMVFETTNPDNAGAFDFRNSVDNNVNVMIGGDLDINATPLSVVFNSEPDLRIVGDDIQLEATDGGIISFIAQDTNQINLGSNEVNLNYGPGALSISGSTTVGDLIITSATPSRIASFDIDGKLVATTTSAGGVTSVTGTYPVISSGSATPNISLAFGTTTANTWVSTQTFGTLVMGAGTASQLDIVGGDLLVRDTQPDINFDWTNTGNYGRMQFKDNGTTIGTLQGIGSTFSVAGRRGDLEFFATASGNDIAFFTNGSNERLKIDKAGDVTVFNKLTTTNASTTNLTVSGFTNLATLTATNASITNASTTNTTVSGTLYATIKQYPTFTYATSTAWAGTTTVPLGVAMVAETWNAIACFTDAGTVNVQISDGTNVMNTVVASTTVNQIPLTSNNTFTTNEKRYVNLGTPASSPTKISCTISKSVATQ